MRRRITPILLGCAIVVSNTLASADAQQKSAEIADSDSEPEAAAAAERGDYSAAVAAYERLVSEYPNSVALRLNLADALKMDRQWARAIDEYETVLRQQPGNADATLGIGTVRRWQGDIAGATNTYKQAIAQAPQNPGGLLGLGSTYALDHDFARAEEVYEQAEKTWPEDGSVRKAAYDFRRQRTPKLYLFWESDLSFATQQAGFIAPFAAKEEIGLEIQRATSYAPQLDHAEIYSRSDQRIFYTHYFGLNRSLDFSARSSKYSYKVPESALGYSAIDTYAEYRVRYTAPLSREQVLSARYTLRPTTLKLSQHGFTAHKLEVELNSRWTPRFLTMLGGGWLRDLDSNATSSSEFTDRSLVKVGFQWDATNRLSLGAKYITNPDLDNSMNATAIADASYSVTETWSALMRYRVDEYKTGPNQTGYYLGVRFVPDSHWWSEVGLKHSERDTASGNYGLVSISYRF